jgi:glycosyltransferase involved in cell wall biosynthesis
MKVSVCIPTYNAAKYLRECIESVLSQTFNDFEIVVSDNASSDATCAIVSSYSDSRIRLHRLEQNQGMAFNFNHAASQAHGEFVKFLCADDLLESECLAKQVDMLEHTPQAIMATSGFRYVDSSSRTIRSISFLPSRRLFNYADVVAGNFIYGHLLGPPAALLIRRSALLKVGAFSTDFPEALDVEMWLRLAALGPVGYLPEPLCSFRLHPQAMTSLLREKGFVRRDLQRITETMLSSVAPSFLVRRVAWGRVAGSILKQALTGLRHGYIKWPLAAFWQALRIDPLFAGLGIFLALFHTGLLGLVADENRRLRVRWGRTLCLSE